MAEAQEEYECIAVPGTDDFIVFPAGTWVRMDGGILDLDRYRGWRHRLRFRARRARGWLCYGWRWW